MSDEAPRPRFVIRDGATAWAPHGDRGWVAVQVVAVLRKEVRVALVLEDESQSRAKRRTVPRDRLLSRDPEKHRRDRPSVPPWVYFGSSTQE